MVSSVDEHDKRLERVEHVLGTLITWVGYPALSIDEKKKLLEMLAPTPEVVGGVDRTIFGEGLL